MTPAGYALLGLTAIVGALAGGLSFVVLRFLAATRNARQLRPSGGGDTGILSAALQEAVQKLRAQERATAARADASERLSDEIISSLTAGLLVADLEGDVRILNPAGRRLLSVPDSVALANYHRMPNLAPLAALIDECFARRLPVTRRTVHLPEGSPGASRLGVSVSPLVERGTLQGAVCLFSDLTAVKALEEQLRLKESLATVGELTAGIAHEFRNGLATIIGYSKLFDLNALPETYRPYVQAIRSEADSLSEVVTNFLNFARPAQLTLSRVDLKAVCDRAAEEVRAEARLLGGDVTIRGEFGSIEGDDVLLRQAFSNLLRNALEACVGASLAPVIVIESRLDRSRNLTRVSVNDNGPGIDPSSREKVFQPFFTSKRNGTGLGLALVQKIIVFHNGRISAESSDLGGASLRIALPLAG